MWERQWKLISSRFPSSVCTATAKTPVGYAPCCNHGNRNSWQQQINLSDKSKFPLPGETENHASGDYGPNTYSGRGEELRSLPSKSFPIHHQYVIPSYQAILAIILDLSLSTPEKRNISQWSFPPGFARLDAMRKWNVGCLWAQFPPPRNLIAYIFTLFTNQKR
jgi:hypothetical protein